jgi:hypothetical protein
MEQSIFIRETLLMKRLMTVFYRLPLWRRSLLAAVIMFLMLHFNVTHKAYAQSTLQNDVSNCESGHYVDYLNLGNLNALVLSCAFATNHDTIAIIAKGCAFDSTVPWQQNVNTDNATWIVDTNSDNTANLIIDFSRSPEVRAQLYDDQDGDGEVSFEIVDGTVNVSESNFPTVVVSAKGDSWFTGARLNANLDFQVDGAVNTMASYGRFLDRLSTDGNTDFIVRVRDTDRDNVADYDLRYDTSPLPQHWGLHRVNLMVNESNNGLPLRNYVLWPLLGSSYAEPVRTAAGNLQLVPYNDEFGRRFGLIKSK